MKNFKIKLILIAIVMLCLILVPMSVNASNENIQIIQKTSSDYMIYVKDNLSSAFEFVFSNNASESITNLDDNLIDSETDSNGNNIAYINSSITDHNYLWVKKDGTYVIEAEEVDLSKSITETQLQQASNITKIVPADLTQTNVKEEIIGDKKVVTTTGKIVLTNSGSSYKYIMVKANANDKTTKAFNLATRISKFNSSTDMYTQISVYKEFSDILSEIMPAVDSALWTNLSGNEIIQPEESADKDEYIVYILEENNKGICNEDIQFLTATKSESEEKIKETIQTKLPVTYDNNILLIVFAIVLILIVFVLIRLNSLKKKSNG